MVFERRFLDILLFGLITGLIITGSIGLGVNFTLASDDGSVITVKSLPSVKVVPKAKYIPVSKKSTPKASISNAILTPKAKQPVVINI